MKLFIAFILIILSFIIAYIRASELKKHKDSSEILLKLSEKLKSNLSSEMRPSFKLCEMFLNEKYGKNVSFSSSGEMTVYLNEEFAALPYITEFTETLSCFPTLSSDELYKCSETLNKIAENGYTKVCDKYKKDSKNAYIVFPGIITVFVLILL